MFATLARSSDCAPFPPPSAINRVGALPRHSIRARIFGTNSRQTDRIGWLCALDRCHMNKYAHICLWAHCYCCCWQPAETCRTDAEHRRTMAMGAPLPRPNSRRRVRSVRRVLQHMHLLSYGKRFVTMEIDDVRMASKLSRRPLIIVPIPLPLTYWRCCCSCCAT